MVECHQSLLLIKCYGLDLNQRHPGLQPSATTGLSYRSILAGHRGIEPHTVEFGAQPAYPERDLCIGGGGWSLTNISGATCHSR